MTVRTRIINRRYRLERRTALTETTETWLGFDNVLHRAVAVTLPRQELLRDGPFLAQFLQRSRIATALHHRGIVAAFDSGEDGDLPYLITEYLGGESLTDIIRAESPFDVDDVAILVEQVAAALDYAHQRGFVHGALDSDDVIVDGQGATKLLGLGLPIGSESLTIEGDIGALGAIAFEMLTGEEPNAMEPDSAGEPYLIAPEVPRDASDIVAIALGSSGARFTSAGAFARSLSGWRSFDPSEFAVIPEPLPDWLNGSDELTPIGPAPFSLSDQSLISLADEPFDQLEAAGAQVGNHNRWIFAAVLVLILAAGFLVWRSSEPTVGATTALPPQIESLAQLTGF